MGIYYNKNISRKLKENQFFGDYMLAWRKSPRHWNGHCKTLGDFINFTLVWYETPQGSEFWNDMYDILKDKKI